MIDHSTILASIGLVLCILASVILIRALRDGGLSSTDEEDVGVSPSPFLSDTARRSHHTQEQVVARRYDKEASRDVKDEYQQVLSELEQIIEKYELANYGRS